MSNRAKLPLSSVCHYCGDKANTQDHIVPRAVLPKPMSQVPYWFRAMNIVPACKECNGWKADKRSDCHCEQCTWAWMVATACFIVKSPPPEIFKAVPKVSMKEYQR